MGLGSLVGRRRGAHRAGLVVHVEVALARAIDAVGPVQAGVEPLGRVGRGALLGQHDADFVEIGLGVLLAVEVAALPAPIGPGPDQAVEHLSGAGLAALALGLGQGGERVLIGLGAPQPGRHTGLLDPGEAGRHTALAEVLLGQNVGCHLAPASRHLDVLGGKHHRTVRIADLARGVPERHVPVNVIAAVGSFDRSRETSRNAHGMPLLSAPVTGSAAKPRPQPSR